MKKSTILHRWLVMLLAAVLAAVLMAPALASSGSDTDTPPDSTDTDNPGDSSSTDTPTRVENFKINDSGGIELSKAAEDEYKITLELGADARGTRLDVDIQPNNSENDARQVSWVLSSGGSDVVQVDPDRVTNGHTAYLIAKAPGRADITVSTGDVKKTIHVTVSGIKLSDKLKVGIQIPENSAAVTLTPGKLSEGADFEYFGVTESAYPDAADSSAVLEVSVVNNKTSVRVSGNKERILVEGVREDTATVTITVLVGSRTYTAEFVVTVTSNESTIHYTSGVSVSHPLYFSELESEIAYQCRNMTSGSLVSISGVSVPTSEGILYLNYKDESSPGTGVGSTLTYYIQSSARGPYIKDIAFVPNASFAGAEATVEYTGTADNGRTFKGKIRITLKEEDTELTITTRQGTPVKLSGSTFSTACQRDTGSPLRYVMFTLPSTTQGRLYKGYTDEYNYTAQVTATEQYNQSDLNDLTFVPTPGYVGTVRLNYQGYSTTGTRYNGELVIVVQQGLDDGIVYNDDGRGEITFSGADFADYCFNATGASISSVQFTPPSASQGTLYYRWQGGSRGSVVSSSDRFFYQSTPRIDYITFVPASGFHGTVRIPFAGYDRLGRSFSGTVELHFQSGGSAEADYTCAPGQSVTLTAEHFNSLCMAQTGQRLHYVTFQSLPDLNQGSLYHNRTSAGGMGTRVSSQAKYYQSASPYLSHVSFWATDSFRGTVEIPFTAASVSGQTFSGLLTIRSGSGNGDGLTNGAVTYETTGQTPVTFRSADFDAACRAATNSAISHIRLALPASSQGILYFDYEPNEPPTAANAETSYYSSGEVSIGKISFHPAYNAAGLVQIPFTGYAIDGTSFQSYISITVHSAVGDSTMVSYATYGEPVQLRANDFQASAGTNRPVSIRFDELPPAEEGKLYYQYTSPTKYSWLANTSTSYSLSSDPLVSNLTFVPRAGFLGLTSLSYTATNADGTQYQGTVRITVERMYSSLLFDDLEGFDSQTLAAVEYLSGQHVVYGMGNRRYGTELAIRRGDFCLMLCRAFQFDTDQPPMAFADVPPEAYYAKAIDTLSALGIVNGTGNNNFMPDASISRQDAALIIQRTLSVAGLPLENGPARVLNGYVDGGQVAGYAQGAVAGLLQQELLPTSENRISPRTNLTRADMAVLMHRAMTQ